MGLSNIFFRHTLSQARRRSFATEFTLRYTIASAFFGVILLGYPICWALAEGANVITPTSEMIWYGILDCFTGPIFFFTYLILLRSVDYSSLGLQSGKFTDTAPRFSAKAAEAGAPAAVETGAV